MIIEKKSFPKYIKLKNDLIQYLKSNVFQPGQAMPTEIEIKESFQVGRNTVRKALAELVNEGIIKKKHGSGSYFIGGSDSRSKSSALIGVIVPKLSFYIYPQIIQGINHAIQKKGYNIVLGSSEVSLQQEMISLNQLLAKNIDGLIIEPSGGIEHLEVSDNFETIKGLHIPVVVIDWMLTDKGVSFVTPNDFLGGFRATDYLIAAGHRRIAYIGPHDKGAGTERLSGYKKALNKAGIKVDEALIKLTSIFDWNKDRIVPDLVNELLTLGNKKPTAFFFFNDDGAIKGYKTLRNAGYEVPGDFSLIGFDDSELATLTDLQLTTMIHPKFKLGKLAAEILLEQLDEVENRQITQLIINPGIVERNSVQKIER